MNYDQYNNYLSNYVVGAKVVSYRYYIIKVDKEKGTYYLNDALKNFSLFFSPNGKLIFSMDISKYGVKNALYKYDDNGLLRLIKEYKDGWRQLTEKSKFKFDEHGRVLKGKIYSAFEGNVLDVLELYVYKYPNAKIQQLFLYSGLDGDDYFIENRYNSKKNIVEYKAIRNDKELVAWSKYFYNENGLLMSEIILDDSGAETDVYLFRLGLNGLDMGYAYNSLDKSYLRSYQYYFDRRGNWIKKVILDDNVERFVTFRDIVYY